MQLGPTRRPFQLFLASPSLLKGLVADYGCGNSLMLPSSIVLQLQQQQSSMQTRLYSCMFLWDLHCHNFSNVFLRQIRAGFRGNSQHGTMGERFSYGTVATSESFRSCGFSRAKPYGTSSGRYGREAFGRKDHGNLFEMNQGRISPKNRIAGAISSGLYLKSKDSWLKVVVYKYRSLRTTGTTGGYHTYGNLCGISRKNNAFAQVLGCKQGSRLQAVRMFHVFIDKDLKDQEKVDPFSLVADELTSLGNRLRLMVSTEVPRLASAAEYFFKLGVEGKRFRPMVLLLMASSLTAVLPGITSEGVAEYTVKDQRLRQQRIAEITEMIHVASLLHDDVLDSAETRRGIGSLNFIMGNKLAVLAGDFLLSRASVSLASLKNTEVVELLSKVLEHLVTGEIMQMTNSPAQRCSVEYYLEKTFYKTASLLANSCKAIALLAGQSKEVATLAYEYGRNLGMAFQVVDDVLDFTGTTASLGKGALSDVQQGIVTAPLIFALEEHPQMYELICRKFEHPGDADLAIELLSKSDGIKKARKLASDHAAQAAAAINSLPPCNFEKAMQCRKALIEITEQVLTRTK